MQGTSVHPPRHKVNLAMIRTLPDGKKASRIAVELWFETEAEAIGAETKLQEALGGLDGEEVEPP